MKHTEQLPVVGIMGGICSGKTAVSEVFEKNGFFRIDADEIVHKLLDGSEIKNRLRQIFGGRIFIRDSELDRKALSDIVFEDGEKLKQLNSIIHPPVINVIKKRLSEAESPVVLDAALLVEVGLDRSLCSFLIFVDRPYRERLKLAVDKRGWKPGELRRRESRQLSPEAKKNRADLVIQNTGSMKKLEESVEKAIGYIMRVHN